jgi:hypothetical protein
MGRAAIDQLLYLLAEAFEGSREHSLLANLKSCSRDDWRWRATGGERTILQIVRHVGECKFVYGNHAFGDQSMRWDTPGTIPTISEGADPGAWVEWLGWGHAALISSVGSLEDDEELLQLRPANWGMEYQTRWLINVMVQHDIYHAGEINHIRALKQGNDSWPD